MCEFMCDILFVESLLESFFLILIVITEKQACNRTSMQNDGIESVQVIAGSDSSTRHRHDLINGAL